VLILANPLKQKLYIMSLPLQGVFIHIFHGVFYVIRSKDCCLVQVLFFMDQFVQHIFEVILRDLRGLI
jgi:hypothetical protein